MRLQTDNLLRIAVSRRWKNAWLLVVLAFFAAPVHAAILTVTKTADTNDGVCNADCSLREAITVANGNGVADLIAFNIPLADPGFNGGTGVWTIVPVGTPLPAIAEPNTTIDGTTQTTNVANTNATVHGTGGLVGFDDLSLSQVNGPEIEIQGQSGFAAGLRASANNTIIRGLAIYGFGNANGDGDIVVDTGVSGGTFEFNVLGARAHLFADPGTRSRAGFATNGGDNWTLQSNVIGFAHNRGAMIRLTSQNWAVRDNEFRDNSLNDLGGDNIAIESSSAPGTVEGNLIAGAASQGVVISGSNANTIVNNTFTDNGVGHTTAAPTQSGALTLRGSADNVTIDRNIFDANYGPGVMINDGSIDNLITRNLFFDNGTIPSRNSSPATGQIGIDLQESSDNQNLGTFPFYNTNDDGDGDSGGNDIFNFAVIKTAQIIGPNLVVSGWSADSATLEFYISDGDPSDFGEGKDFVFTDDEGSAGDSDGGTSFYGPAAVNGVLQGDESPIREYTFTVPTASLPVPVTAADKLVATATLASQTSEFSARAPVDVGTISGTIFVDLVGDGLADGPIGPLPNPYESGTRIELWLDGGDGIPDGGDDTYESFTTSALADGTYQFAGLRNGTYWVTVDAGGVNRGPYNGGYSGADAWAEQTYGPVGAASFDGSSWSYLPAAGALYGGARWNVSNNFPPTNSLPTAEHIGRVIVADNDTTNADFGFSFNVVTTTRGGDGTVDPGQPPGQRTVQGSLRQFLTNANAQTAANIMRFVPAAPTNGSDAGNNWWRVDVTSPLPVIADTATTVDGAAYSNTDGITSIDPNDANIGAGETVGVDLLFTTPILDPELELEVTGIDHGIEVDAASAVIRNISIWKSDEHDLLIGDGGGASFTGTLIEQNVIGTPPHRFDNSFTATGNDLIDVFADADTGILQNNLIGFGDGGGFSPDLGATPWLVFQNEIRGIGRAAGWGPAQDAVGDGAPGIIIRGNLLVDSAGGGVESNLMPGGFTIEQNTFRNNGTVSPETFQIRLMGTTGNSVTRNIFDAGNGPAIIVVSDHGVFPVYGASEANLISQNQFNGNHAGIAIDLLDAGSPSIEHENGDGITLNDGGTVANDGNDGLDFPVIDAVMLGGSLTVTGFARPGVTVEFYKALGTANDQNTGGTEHGEGLEYLFTAVEGSGADSDATTGSYASADYGSDPAANRFSFTVAAPAGLSLGDPVSAIAIDGSNNTSEFGPNLLVTAGSSVAGTVFEDADFAGTATDYDGAVNDLPLPNVDVELYTNTDTYVNSTTTDASGNYSFIVPPATYKIRVRSATIGDSNTPPAGTFNAACGITDPVSGPPCVLAEMTWANGAKYGGDDAAADDTTTNNDAGPGDTWNSIVFAGDQTGINFGFAYNLISNTKDKGQGSLRQFIENANDIGSAAGTTANTSQFRIPATDPGYTVARGVYTISPATELTTVTDAATIIDATTQTSNVADSNGGLLGAGGTVGTGADGVAGTGDDPALGQVAAPEIEIVGTSALDTGINIAA
ncbi:MAG: right-handed parallel beta-helix repeat-containing protein, partial [Gammaproteobacteria bacterium]|nr:right-handed parallel beta-helix repeat-containing protein [Gammaproteobacteria bacterium]